jgi:hypothetical protein
MSPQGTAAYDGLTDLPPLVERAVDLARRLGFASSARPERGVYPPTQRSCSSRAAPSSSTT